MVSVSTDAIARHFREEYGRTVATLVRSFGDIDLAEEAVQEAFVVGCGQMADSRPTPESGSLDHHHRPQPGHRPFAAGGVPT